MPIEPGLEKALYKTIKKHAKKRVDLLAAFPAELNADFGLFPEVSINVMCGISETDIWLIRKESVQELPLRHLQPGFARPYKYVGNSQHKYSIPDEFSFEFLPNQGKLSLRPLESTKQVNEFSIWLDVANERLLLNWWDI